jgi:hypothetical protein
MHLPVGKLVDKLIYGDASGLTRRYTVLLFTGNLTRMTTSTILIIN